MAQIIIMDGPGVGTCFEIKNGINTLGSSESCNMTIPDEALRAIELRINKDEKGCILTSKTVDGVSINGKSVQQQKLVHGDMIATGNYLLLYGEEIFSRDEENHENSLTVKAQKTIDGRLNKALYEIEKTRYSREYKYALSQIERQLCKTDKDTKEICGEVLQTILETIGGGEGRIFIKKEGMKNFVPLIQKKLL